MYRKKLYLSILCIIVLAMTCTGLNIILREHNNSKESISDDNDLIEGNIVSRACAAKMLSLLYYTRDEIVNMPVISRYNDIGEGKWYDKYFYAMDSLGVVWGNDRCRPMDNLTYAEAENICGYFKTILVKSEYNDAQATNMASVTGSAINSVTGGSYNVNDYISVDEWMILYSSLMEMTKDNGEPLFRTMNRERIFLLSIVEDDSDSWSIMTDKGRLYFDGYAFDAYTNSSVDILTDGSEVVYIYGQVDDVSVLENVLVRSYSEDEISVFCCNAGIDVLITEGVYNILNQSVNSKPGEDVMPVVADITVDKGIVTDINIYNDRRKDKILSVTETVIETSNYGRLEYTPSCIVYGIYDEYKVLSSGDIAVGYSLADIVINGEGRVCAVLITDKLKPETIRVAVMTTGYKGYYHNKVSITSDTGMTVTDVNGTREYAPGEIVKYNTQNDELVKGRINIVPNDCGKIIVNNIKRSYGKPAYRGNIELALYEQGIVIVNELSIEEYLYAVVPSEMPVSYGAEPLKAQSVCARSYAYMQIANGKLGNIGAHVDDSTAYQVYNNTKETEESINAVNATAGRVLQYNGEVISTYYFSTSCGYTADAVDVWVGMKDVPYLKGSLQQVETPSPKQPEAPENGDIQENVSEAGIAVTNQAQAVDSTGVINSAEDSDEEKRPDLSKDKAVRKFIDEPPCETYDSKFPWYRWNVTLTAGDVKKSVEAALKTRYEVNPALILVKNDNGDYVSTPIDSIGDIKSIKVANRQRSGIVTELIIKGTKHTIKIISEYNIRAMLAPVNSAITRNDKTTVTQLTLLPSAFIYIDTVKDGNELSFTIHGGGYGHGVGMSQNGAKTMADTGYDYIGILRHYYPGSEIADQNKSIN